MASNVPLSRFSDSSDELEKSRTLKHSRSCEEPEWFPTIFQQVLGIDNLPVVYYEDEYLDDFLKDLNADQYCGITAIKRAQLMPLICLTTSQNIVVMNLTNHVHIEHMKIIMKRSDLIFFVMHGSRIHDLLKTNGIKIKNLIDLVTFDIHVKLRTHFAERVPLRGKYFLSYVHQEVKITPHNYSRLSEKWLDVKSESCSSQEHSSLSRLPLDTQACNVIRKSAALTRAIGLRIWDEFEKIHQTRRDQIFSFGVRAPDDIIEEYKRTDKESWEHLVTRIRQCPGTSYLD